MSRSVWSKRDHQREESPNDATMGALGLFARPAVEVDERPFSSVFLEHYGRIRDVLSTHPEPGLALFVASREGLEASAWWRAPERDVHPLILGRHGSADVFLPSDPLLSLRHLAVIIHPHREAEPVRFRVVDLRTPIAFCDEGGRELEAVEANGPLLLRLSSLNALLFPTGGWDEPWPEDPEAAWARVPERVHLQSATADSGRWRDLEGRWPRADLEAFDPSGGPPTLSTSFPGPAFVGCDLAGSDCPRGTLSVHSEGQTVSLRLGQTAMKQGVLLGRYERCESGGIALLTNSALSRVHLLLIEMAGRFFAVDTGSKNGVWHGERRIRMIRLESGVELTLARHARVGWRSLH
jgi:hypothetical protein